MKCCYNNRWEQDISKFDWFFTSNNTSSKVIAITIGTIYEIIFLDFKVTQSLLLLALASELAKSKYSAEYFDLATAAAAAVAQSNARCSAACFASFTNFAYNGASLEPVLY